MNTIRRISAVAATALLLVTFTGGCFNPFAPPVAPQRGISSPPPVPNTPTNLLRLFEWCYNERAIVQYRELFTEDYRFKFSALDPSGEPFVNAPWTRNDELISATQLFQGGSAEQPPASSIDLRLARTFNVIPDTREGKNGKWHKKTRTTVVLRIRTADGDATDITGAATFFLVRGDSAAIPEELRLLGFEPDSNRWYIELWEDDTAQPEGVQALVAMARPGDAAVRAAVPVTRNVTSTARARHTHVSRRDSPQAPTLADAIREVVSWGALKAYYRAR